MELRFGFKYMPGNDLSDFELLKVLYCDWPKIKELYLSNRDLKEETLTFQNQEEHFSRKFLSTGLANLRKKSFDCSIFMKYTL